MKKLLSALLSLLFLTSFSIAEDSVSSTFSHIYNEKTWGENEKGEGTSGPGSVFENAKEYVAFIKGFLASHSCMSVVDIGCGDWELFKHINWDSIQYNGYDVVQSIIDKNIKNYGSENIQFFCADGICSDTPQADVLICKDLLQHLPNDMIFEFLNKLDHYKYCLITNDIIVFNDMKSLNQDRPIGGYRPIDLTLSPFNLKATPILTFDCAGVTKQVLLVKRE